MRFLILTRLVFGRVLARKASSVVGGAAVALAVVVAGVAGSSALLSLFFGMEDRASQERFLAFLLLVVAVCCLIAQSMFRVPVVLLFEVRPLLALPFSFRGLFWWRALLSTGGLWVLALGPAAIWLVSAQATGVASLAVTGAGGLVFVWTLGRLATILSLTAGRLSTGIPSSLLLLALFAAAFYGYGLVIGFLFGEELSAESGVAEPGQPFWEASILTLVEYTPVGLLAGIVMSLEAPRADLAKLGAMLAMLGGLLWLEWRMLRRHCERWDDRVHSTVTGTMPVTHVLRRSRRLAPAAVLWLVETECFLRFRRARVPVLVCCAYGLVHAIPLPVLGLPFAMMMMCAFMHGARPLPPTCYMWRDSLTLPVPVVEVLRTPGRSSASLALALLVCMIGLMVAWSDSRWLTQGVASGVALSTVLVANGCGSLVQAYWPPHRIDPARRELDLRADFVGLLPVMATFAVAAIGFGLYLVDGQYGVSSAVVGAAGGGCLIMALAAWLAATKWQGRVVSRRGGGDYLLRTERNRKRTRYR